MKRLLLLTSLLCAVMPVAASAKDRILVYTRSYTADGKGYVHENRQTSVEAIRKMGSANGFEVDASEDPSMFTKERLKQYKVLVFASSNNEAFENDAQREAFKSYIQSGGGFVGIHSASGSERNWPYFTSVVGGKFLRHPKLQKFVVRVKDPRHPATRGLPATFEWEDECYYNINLNPGMHVLLVTDPAKLVDDQPGDYPGNRFGDALPLAWYQTFDGGRQFYTALGHKLEHYSDPLLQKQILGGILWAMGREK